MEQDVLNDYLSAISKLEHIYCSCRENSQYAVQLLFRGVSDRDYSLKPSVMRGYKKYSREETILQRFIKEASVLERGIEEDNYKKWSELAQHFGAPTRLLDWTTNPLVALFFACSSNPDKDAKIWVLYPFNYVHFLVNRNWLETKPLDALAFDLIHSNGKGENMPKYPIIYVPDYIDERMSNQSSYFMLWGTDEDGLEQMIPANAYMDVAATEKEDKKSEKCLFSYTVPAKQKHMILKKLDQLGVNEKTIYPGMDGIGKYVERFYHVEKDS